MYVVHVRRIYTPYMYGRDLLLLWQRPIFCGVMVNRLAMLAAVSIIIIRRRCRLREARVGREWSQDWLKERQLEKGMEEFVVTELAAYLGGFHSFIRMHFTISGMIYSEI